MSKPLEIVLLIALPAAWGLIVEFVFEHLRRRRDDGQASGCGDSADGDDR